MLNERSATHTHANTREGKVFPGLTHDEYICIFPFCQPEHAGVIRDNVNNAG